MDQMGEGALLVTLGSGISATVNERVHRLADTLRQLAPAGLTDLVPAYASLLVLYDDTLVEEQALIQVIGEALASPAGSSEAKGRTHTIPVAYGGENGPDLENLSAALGLSTGELVRRHTGPSYRVYFLGFMPGFAYLGGLDPSIAAPRLKSPRTRVPVGSVGIAGEQTGIYPLSSPGGWQLIGRTATPLWNIDSDPPAVLAPRDEVRFVESEEQTFTSTSAQHGSAPHEPDALPVFTVEAPGALTTMQDLGRPGYGSVGLSVGGAMDPQGAIEANRLVGNPPQEAVLEITWSGPTLRAVATTVLGLAGTDLGCLVGERHVPCGTSWLVRAGTEVRFARRETGPAGARSYLAVAGGFSAVPVLGSTATYLPGGFGGLGGRQLKAGDTLFALPYGRSSAELAGRVRPGLAVRLGEVNHLRYVAYTGPGGVAHEARERASSLEYEVSAASDRMGVRLVPDVEGALAWSGPELTSFGVVRGAIQLPPGGSPVVLGADHQTTGGYPILGVVARADWPLLAQLRPGHKVRLQPVTLQEARATRLPSHGPWA